MEDSSAKAKDAVLAVVASSAVGEIVPSGGGQEPDHMPGFQGDADDDDEAIARLLGPHEADAHVHAAAPASRAASDGGLKRKLSCEQSRSSGLSLGGETEEEACKKLKGKADSSSEKVKVGYTREEALSFNKDIMAIGKDESRLKCAGDDILCSLNHVVDMEFNEEERRTSQEAILRAKALCLSLFFEFMLSGEVAINAKKIRAYSALRPELQHLVRTAKAKISLSGSEKDPVALARELTQELIDAPVQVVVEGDDDGHTRIANFLQKRPQDVEFLKKLIVETIDLPMNMHDGVIQCLKLSVNKSYQLVDYLSTIFKQLQGNIRVSWICFATDVCNYFAATGGFANGCEQASVWTCFKVTKPVST